MLNVKSKEPNLKIYYLRCNASNGKKFRSPWFINLYLPETKKAYGFGKYRLKEEAEKIIEYIRQKNIILTTEEEVKAARQVIQEFTAEIGLDYRIRQGRRQNSLRTYADIKIYERKKWNEKRPCRTPFCVSINLPQPFKTVNIGTYKTKEFAEKIVEYIETEGFVFASVEDVKAAKDKIRIWAIENGYSNGYTKSILNLKGSRRGNHGRIIGSERVSDGYVVVKTENGWKAKHRLILEEAGHNIPENHNVFFKDGNKLNFDLENLEVLPLSEFLRRNNLLKFPDELRPTLDLLWRLKQAIKEQKSDTYTKNKRSVFNLKIHKDSYHSKNISWVVRLYCRAISTNNLFIGYYKSHEIAEEIVDFIKTSNFSIKSREDIENVKSLVKDFAVAKGYCRVSKSKNKNNSFEINTAKAVKEENYV